MISNSLAKDKNSDQFTILRSKLRTESLQSVLHISLSDSKDSSFPFKPRKADLTAAVQTARAHPCE